jgi:hypothetical protein
LFLFLFFFLSAGLDGSVSLLCPLDLSMFRRLAALQQQIALHLAEPLAGLPALSFRLARRPWGSLLEKPPRRLVVDGDLLYQ